MAANLCIHGVAGCFVAEGHRREMALCNIVRRYAAKQDDLSLSIRSVLEFGQDTGTIVYTDTLHLTTLGVSAMVPMILKAMERSNALFAVTDSMCCPLRNYYAGSGYPSKAFQDFDRIEDRSRN